MFWLIWQMGVLLLIAIGFGVFIGYQIWSGDARSAEADKALAENARLRRENETLARRLGEASTRSAVADTRGPEAPAAAETRPGPVEPVKSGAAAEPAGATAEPAGEDDLTRIKGLGPKAEAALKAGGITRLNQIAEWTETDIEVWDERINGRGRIVRDNWVAQAKELAG
jgi:predicted flap endonuclease-1-like 5' DNA nuclease